MNLLQHSKRSFTLIEVMVAFSLVALLLTIGFGAYSQMSFLEKEGDAWRHITMQERLAQSRLAALFLRVPQPDLYGLKLKGLPARVFYLSERAEPGLFMPGSLVFTYDNQTDLWPEFCNNVVARLYVKEGQNAERGRGDSLWLATWPRPDCSMDPSLARHELLLDGVTSMECKFYALPELSNDKVDGSKGSKDDLKLPQPIASSWNTTWSIAYSQLPLVIHVTLERKKRGEEKMPPLDFYFPLLNTSRIPILADHQ